MTTEFKRRFEELNLKDNLIQKIEKIINAAGTEFPCLSCLSKDDCANFKWCLKWFGKEFKKC